MQQYMMRARVVAQGSTLGAVILGLGYATYKEMQAKKQRESVKWTRFYTGNEEPISNIVVLLYKTLQLIKLFDVAVKYL